MRKSAIVDLLKSPFYNVQRGSRSKLKGKNYKEKKIGLKSIWITARYLSIILSNFFSCYDSIKLESLTYAKQCTRPMLYSLMTFVR